MDRDRILALIREVEQNTDPFSMVVDGMHIWPFLRIKVAEMLFGAKNTPELDLITSAEKPPISRSATLVKSLLTTRALRSMKNAPPDLLLMSEWSFLENSGTCWSDRFMDPICSVHGSTCTLTRYEGMEPNRCVDASRLDQSAYLKWKSWVWSKRDRIDLRKSEDVRNVLSNMLGEGSDRSMETLNDHFHTLRFFHRYYRSLLLRIKPRMIFMVCWYGVDNMGLCHAAHEMGIPTVDLQHGVQGEAHFAYGPWRGVGADSRGLMPTIFWCWDERSASNLRSWITRPEQHVITGGNLWIMGYKDLRQKYSGSHEQTLPTSKKTVALFTCQPVDDPLPEMLLQVIQETKDHIDWWVRLHPNQGEASSTVRSTLTMIGVLDQHIDGPTNAPLPEVLARVDIHITRWSSVVLEATATGVPSITIDPQGATLFGKDDHMLHNNATTHNELIRALNSAKIDRTHGAFVPGDTRAQVKSTIDRLLGEFASDRIPSNKKTTA